LSKTQKQERHKHSKIQHKIKQKKMSSYDVDNRSVSSSASSSVSSFKNAQLIAATFGSIVAGTTTSDLTPHTNNTPTEMLVGVSNSSKKSKSNSSVGNKTNSNFRHQSDDDTGQNCDVDDSESACTAVSSRNITSADDDEEFLDKDTSENKVITFLFSIKSKENVLS
jgi:hypothetical protein